MKTRIREVFARFLQKSVLTTNIGTAIILMMLGIVVYDVTKAEVIISHEGEMISLETHASTVEAVMEEQDIEVASHDYIAPALDTPVEDEILIEYKSAQQVTVSLEGEEEEMWTTVDTVDELMEEISVDVSQHDAVEPSLHAEIKDGIEIFYEKAFPVTLEAEGQEEEIWTVPATVEEILEEENIELNELDKVIPSEDEVVTESTEIELVRVEKEEEIEEETVNFKIVTKEDDSLAIGREAVVQPGTAGKIKKHYEVTLENGEEVSRELVSEEIVQKSKDQIVAVGTKEPVQVAAASTEKKPASEDSEAAVSKEKNNTASITADAEEAAPPKEAQKKNTTAETQSSENEAENNEQTEKEEEWKTFAATAYTADCSGCSGITQTGMNLKANPDARVVAVDPGVIPLGSRVEVKGRGEFIAADTGGAVNGNKIDIFMPSRDKALSFGSRSVEVRVID
ncbi:ubiquitin-like domain-containing protein [Alkalicoccus daliensis]|uniref:Uncharacterized conserved protein YabE, contains G5 and tandem DUF348 domains n=1 Tax=Alkalicoccus daliensis TaxID=745820 RepID=A0A1H0KTL4_9BACI|nr:G5 and 3D domain-containing protein [Alkalicoccus daliensis]SDO59344.1 Uncharacterized conserved protein YabE, contains G5 and tandem DUF348 domains [Alkalicoccus daliensis]